MKEISKAIKLLKAAIDILESEEKQHKIQLASLSPGEIFLIGKHEFLVLEQHKDGTTSVISRNFMAENVLFDNKSRDYSKSYLKRFIESEIRPVILGNIGDGNLVEHEIDLTSVDNQHEFRSLTCDVRPLTFDEVRRYNDLLVNEDLMDWCWTITPWSTADRGWDVAIVTVSPSSRIGYSSYHNHRGVRPFCILKSNIFVSKGET